MLFTEYTAEIIPESNIDAVIVQTEQLANKWIVSAAEAKYLIQQGAVVLDVRDRHVQSSGLVQGAIAVSWQQFSQPEFPDRGNLLKDEAVLAQKLRDVGVSNNKAVVVVGDPRNGWGEDGRIVWMLRTLGHKQTVFVDGGYAALVKTGLPTTENITQTAAISGNFTIQRTTDWEISQSELKAALSHGNLVEIDTREPREFRGATPYGEKRGGHIPGAISLYYKELLDAEGKLLPRERILNLLRDRGISTKAVIVSYCSGGVRSGWLTSVLVNLGFQAQNYAGSMWEWSAGSPNQYPLVEEE
jgi:thiosulfate/3-mercaptopyruvate sulfurtransferase